VFVSADPRSEFVAAVIVPERDYLLRKLAEASADAAATLEQFQSLTPAEYQDILDNDKNVKIIISGELLKKEEEFKLPPYERIAENYRYYLSAKPFIVSHAGQEESKESAAGVQVLTNTMKLKRVEAARFFKNELEAITHGPSVALVSDSHAQPEELEDA
jgi:16S rRNA C1402 (ribose-2'-O) methylase RsmI